MGRTTTTSAIIIIYTIRIITITIRVNCSGRHVHNAMSRMRMPFAGESGVYQRISYAKIQKRFVAERFWPEIENCFGPFIRSRTFKSCPRPLGRCFVFSSLFLQSIRNGSCSHGTDIRKLYLFQSEHIYVYAFKCLLLHPLTSEIDILQRLALYTFKCRRWFPFGNYYWAWSPNWIVRIGN